MKPNNGKPKFGGYIRVSTEEQVEHGHSIEAQEARLLEEAKRKGWHLVVYKDEGYSAKNEKRPDYQNLLKDLEEGKLDGVAVVRLDRLWRSLLGSLKAIELICHDWKRSLVSLNEQVDTTTPAGRAMLNMVLTFAQLERETTSSRVNEAGKHRARQGKWAGNTPFGYRIFDKKKLRVAEKGKLAVDEDQARTVREIFKMFLEKRTVRGVCLTLNERGIRTKRDDTWAIESVRRVLTNSAYVGDLIYNRRDTGGKKTIHRSAKDYIRVQNVLPRIVDDKIFNTAQQILQSRVLKTRAQSSSYLLSGLLRCRRCGKNMVGVGMTSGWDRSRGKKNGKRYTYYKCYSYMQKGPKVCQGTSVPADALEDALVTTLLRLHIDPKKLQGLVNEQCAGSAKEIEPLKRNLGRLEKALARWGVRDDKIKTAYECGDYDVAELRVRLAKAKEEGEKLEVDREAARVRLSQAQMENFDPNGLVEFLESAHDLLIRQKDFDKQRAFLAQLIDKVVVDRQGGEFHLKSLPEWAMVSKKKGFWDLQNRTWNLVISEHRFARAGT